MPSPSSAGLAEIARDALLHQLGRGDARQALNLALAALAVHQGGPCGLAALGPTSEIPGEIPGELPGETPGEVRWQAGHCSGPRLPVAELGSQQGWLYLPAPQPVQALAALLPTLAALLQRDAWDASPAGQPGRRETHATLLRAALAGTDTFTWEWDLDNDWLGDIDEGLRLLGYQVHEVGHTQEDWNRLIHPEDLADNDLAFQRHAAGETEIYEHAYRARHRSGQWRWMLERGRIVERHPDGRPRRVVGTQVDITERRAAERLASEAVQRLEQIARQVPGMLYMFELQRGRGGFLRYASERGPALFGLPPLPEQRDMNVIWAMVPPEDQRRMYASFQRSAQTLCDWTSDFRVQRPDGEWRHMSARSTPQRVSETMTRWYGYIEDVTERVQLDEARRDAALASAANRAKTDFLSRMSHELRTPLNAVLGFTQLIEIDHADPPSPGQRRRLQLIREAGEHLLSMISDLLDLTRIESGGMALALEPLAVHELAAQVLQMMRSAAQTAQVSLQMLPGGETLLVQADRTRLRQVLLNLLSNAVKYNRAGGSVALQVQATADGQVMLSVADTGLGIAEADLPMIFEPFQRGPQAHGTVEGAGIGLSVTQALVRLMHGQVRVESQLGRGSRFDVLLPRVGAAGATGAAGAAGASGAAGAAGAQSAT